MLRIVLSVLLFTAGVSGHPNQTPGQEQRSGQQAQPVGVSGDHIDAQSESDKHQSSPPDNAPSGNAPLKGPIVGWDDPNVWLVVVTSITGIFIAWQAKETRASAKAAADNISIIKTKDRAKILLSLKPKSFGVGSFPEVEMVVHNVGESKAFIDLSVAGLHFSESEQIEGTGSGYYQLKSNDAVLGPDDFIEEKIFWPGHALERYSDEMSRACFINRFGLKLWTFG